MAYTAVELYISPEDNQESLSGRMWMEAVFFEYFEVTTSNLPKETEKN
jgi:hypothetical protein